MNRLNLLKKLSTNHWLIFIICLLAAIRVFIYSSAFPFFNNVDEWSHFDMVMKYSHWHVPGSLETVLPESASYVITYGSPEYSIKPDEVLTKGIPAPLWKQSKEKLQYSKEKLMPLCNTINNPESTQPPFYYMVAGTWARLGYMGGLRGAWFLYWIRYLNVILAAALVWLAYLAASRLFPENRFIVLGVPLLAAFIPQDAFYSVQSDVLSPVCYGLALIGMISFMCADVPKLRHGILTVLALAATVLVKLSNLLLVAVVMLAILYKVIRLIKSHKLRSAALLLGLFAICLLIPLLTWFAWNYFNTGDFTGTASKIQNMGWTHKSFHDIFIIPSFHLGDCGFSGHC